MANYAEAFAEGLQAHKKAARAKAEIADVLRSFSEEVRLASDRAIPGVETRSLSRVLPPRTFREAVDSFGTPRHEEYEALVATNRAGKEGELCEIGVAVEGYPVRLAFGGGDIRCHDRLSLEEALAALLKHPNTGAVVARLMGESSESGPTEPAAEEGG